ncbi:MAG: ammonia channel protein, partial [Pedosphaera sp.]|nr:ammonia channel protein [Pedosphaera sp.]
MKNLLLVTSLMAGLLFTGATLRAADEPATNAAAAVVAAATNAPAAAPAPKDPTLDQRVADLEAYVNNAARATATDTNVVSKVSGSGPGHNAFQMVCAALVLFMTLPGLALFYGGLVRRKNVLSVMAQCLGIAGLVTILWWLCGYSIAFHASTGNGFWGSLEWKFLQGVDS